MSAAPVDDPALDARLRDAAARFFTALKGTSFGRCDIRVDRAGTPFMLEINPNCGVFYPRAIRAARISASRTMRKATPDSPAS